MSLAEEVHTIYELHALNFFPFIFDRPAAASLKFLMAKRPRPYARARMPRGGACSCRTFGPAALSLFGPFQRRETEMAAQMDAEIEEESLVDE